MIKKLRFKMIGVSMLSLVLVLGVVLLLANVISYREVIADADLTLSILAENQGTFPESYEEWGERAILDSEELAYETRFFYVLLNDDGDAVLTSTDQIAAVDQHAAEEYAQDVYISGNTKGFTDVYRYLTAETDEGTLIIFLDCNRSISNARRLALISVGVSIGGLGVVFFLLLIISEKVMAPFAENYEKQKRFITDAGHELKTPLAVIAADTEVLEMDLERNEWLADIKAQTVRLTELTNDLIVLSRMEERNDSSAQMEEIDFSALAAETGDSFQMMAAAQKKDLYCEIEPEIRICGDEKALRRLVSILLDNACKYSEAGGKIRLELKKAKRQVRLSVYNTTPEIKRETLPHLFDRFYRTDESRNSQTGGYGLGLSIAASTVAAHKGKITAATEDGKSLLITAVFPV
ncbi:MAG: HAMP domain-containing histidine kinase [Clostridiales bacterium]|nr:HAMP domain-containing histidine kinase [Clostridiales bacterium]